MKDFQIGVKALIVDNGNILLMKRSKKYHGASLEGVLDIPGGRINFGEEPIDGLRREIKEETGMELDNIKRILDASTIFKDEKRHIVRITYLCSVKDTNVVMSEEHTEIQWTPLEKIDFEFKDKLIGKCVKLIST